MRWIYGALSLFSKDLSPEALAFDKKASKFVTIIGIPSAFLLHGYVGFIFGSVKANPWWGSVLMPIVFLMSAIVSGIAMVMFLYILVSLLRNEKLDMRCLDKIGQFLLVAIIVDFALEALDYIHRIYQSEESIGILTQLVSSRLFTEHGHRAAVARHAAAAPDYRLLSASRASTRTCAGCCISPRRC